MKTTYRAPFERGILTSDYKNEIRDNSVYGKRKTLSRMKSIIEEYQDRCQNQACTIIQVSLFAFALVLVIV